jgi:hypothetical protein
MATLASVCHEVERGLVATTMQPSTELGASVPGHPGPRYRSRLEPARAAAGEVAARRLEDIDWQRGEITVQGNGNRHELLPPPVDVGKAVWAHPSEPRVLDATSAR